MFVAAREVCLKHGKWWNMQRVSLCCNKLQYENILIHWGHLVQSPAKLGPSTVRFGAAHSAASIWLRWIQLRIRCLWAFGYILEPSGATKNSATMNSLFQPGKFWSASPTSWDELMPGRNCIRSNTELSSLKQWGFKGKVWQHFSDSTWQHLATPEAMQTAGHR